MPSHARLQRSLWFLLFAVVLLNASPARTREAASGTGLAGTWAGDITTSVSYSTVPLVLMLRDADGTITGTGGPSVHDQSPLTDVRVVAGRLACTLEARPALRFVFDLGMADGRLTGTVDATDHDQHWRGAVRLDREPAATTSLAITEGHRPASRTR